MPKNITVEFLPSGRTITAPSGQTVRKYALQAGECIDAPCGGTGTCGKCAIWIFGLRMQACKITVLTDMQVWTIDPKQRIPESGDIRIESGAPQPAEVQTNEYSAVHWGIAIDIGTTTIVASIVQLPASSLPASTKTNIGIADASSVQKNSLSSVPTANQEQFNSSNNSNVSLFQRLERLVVYTRGRLNPQTSIGADVISRIQCNIEFGEEGLDHLNRLIIDAIDQLIAELLSAIGETTDCVQRVTVSGNTTMESLFARVSVESLGASPFLSILPQNPKVQPGNAYGLACNAQTTLLPCICGFLGGDTTAGVFMVEQKIKSSSPQTNGPWLLIDIGTNGEIVLCDKNNQYWGTSAAAGPAFEGAGISLGMRALPGAIESVTLRQDGTLDWATIDNAPPRGICGSGLLDLGACLLKTGAIDQKGKLRTRPGKPLNITAADVRQIQLAIGAIKTAIVVLLRKAGLKTADLTKIHIAGGFGKHIKIDSILDLGLIPDGKEQLLPKQIEYLGNSSLWTAEALTIQPEILEDLNRIAESIHTINLAQEPDFIALFAQSMRFPAQSE